MRGVSNGGKWSKAADKRRKKKKAIAITFPTRGTVLKTRSFTNPVASYAARCAWDSGTSLSGNDGRYVGRRCQTIREEIKSVERRRGSIEIERPLYVVVVVVVVVKRVGSAVAASDSTARCC